MPRHARRRFVLATASVLVTAAGEPQPPVLANFPAGELVDIDCDRVHSSLVDWSIVRSSVQQLDAAWTAEGPALADACSSLELQSSDVHVVLARTGDAAAECVLGATAAVLVLLVCSLGCSVEAQDAVAPFEDLWKRLLATLPLYVLGTSSWPVASMLAKWQAHCEWQRGPHSPCPSDGAVEFAETLQLAADTQLMPLLWRPEDEGPPPELALGLFMHSVLQALTTFLNGPHAESPEMATSCRGVGAALGVLLVLLRLLGPPVSRDPLHGPRLDELGALAASLRLGELLKATPRAFAAVLAALRFLTWRSHRLFGEIPFSEVRQVLRLGAAQLRGVQASSAGLLDALQGSELVRRELWQVVATSLGLTALWRQLARWLLSGDSSSLVYLTMGFGPIDALWLRSYLLRALDVGLQRLVFVTPDRGWLLTCEDVRRGEGATGRLLCVRTFTLFSRPYDHNNKAKFFMFPLLLALGVDVAWLDIDIFLFKDPTRRLLQQRYEDPAEPKDVLVTDHFDEYCLNHGVFVVRASDRSLLWMLEYLRWLHWYPFGHDQNGWDAFLGHSIVEPQIPDNLRTNPAANASYGVLSTELEYVTLTGWAGNALQRRRALLLHFTTTQGISGREKKRRLLALFNATARRSGEARPDRRRLQMATWKELLRLRAGMPVFKRPCYEGIHEAVGLLVQSGLYEELLA